MRRPQTGVQRGRVDGFRGDPIYDASERKAVHDAAVREAKETTQVRVHHPERQPSAADVFGYPSTARPDPIARPAQHRWETPLQALARLEGESDDD